MSSGPLQGQGFPLSPAEQASIGPMTASRLAEFSLGRFHARLALARLGVVHPSIPVSPNRAPVWPSGFVGSISHTPADPVSKRAGQVIAVVARSTDYAGLGVDLERYKRFMPEHWSRFLSPEECEWLATCRVEERGQFAHGLWSAKEAAMKALSQPLDPHAIAIAMQEQNPSRFSARCRVPQTAGEVREVVLDGYLTFSIAGITALAVLEVGQMAKVQGD